MQHQCDVKITFAGIFEKQCPEKAIAFYKKNKLIRAFCREHAKEAEADGGIRVPKKEYNPNK